jgi:hypothetical protein
VTHSVIYNLNLTSVSQGLYGGFQDVEQDPDSNVYIVGTFPSSILKVNTLGTRVEPWYLPSGPLNHTLAGLSGLAAKGWTLLANDDLSGQLWRFDMRAPKGTPTVVPLSPNLSLGVSDAIYLPPLYSGTVLLVAQDEAGVAVLRSKDGTWGASGQVVEHRGVIPWNQTLLAEGFFLTATVQVGNSLYIVPEPFDPAVSPWGAGNRTDFPFLDITHAVAGLLA